MTEEKPKQFFDEEKQKKVTTWLENKWPNKVCDICNSQNWSVVDFISAPSRYEKGLVLGGKIAPQITVVCNNCGNTKFFNAVVIGLIEPEKKIEGEENVSSQS